MRSLPIWFAIVCGLALFLGLSVRRDRRRDHYDLASSDTALPKIAERHGYALRELEVAKDVRLRGMLRMPSGAGRLVLFFPGNTDPQLSVSVPILEHVRNGGGLGAAAFTYRGFDGSGGVPSPAAAEHDARAELHHVREALEIPPARTVVMGYSLGSGIALRLAAELSRAGQPPAAVVLLSPYWSLPMAPAHPLEFFLPSEHYGVEDIAGSVRAPVLVVAGSNDEALPVASHARKLVPALGANATYWEVRGSDHVAYLEDASLLARIGRFIEQAR